MAETEPARLEAFEKLLRVAPRTRPGVARIDASSTHGWTKEAARPVLERGLDQLAGLQERLWAERRHRVLVVLQGMDCSGKGGTIEHVMGAFNPAGCPVSSFKVPTEIELAHDYLWRIHARTPARGDIGIWDRSHYEDVLVVRVKQLVPRSVWARRYRQIAAFERTLAEEGTTILKFFLHIDKDEQRERLQARLDDPTKRWKFRLGDIDERKRWDDYMAAYEDAIAKTSTDLAPWYIVPANHKWFRNLAVASILVETLERLDPRYPEPEEIPEDLVIE
jgi:PPK2 family polyphosphate:nucleotide phosphotransferase